MKNIALILLAFLMHVSGVSVLMAQGEDNIWVFGRGLGLNFNSGTGEVISTSQFGYGGTAAVSDAEGNLLFYTNGYWVWNRNHELMPELTGGIAGYTSPVSPTIGYPPIISYPGAYCYQGATIVNTPNQANKYYIFSTNNSYLFYTQIDMDLNEGMGGIVMDKKGIPMIASTNGALTTVKGCNCVWVVCQAYGQNRFYAFEVNDTGIVMQPVVSDAGSIPEAWNYRGCISFSPDGTRLAKTTNDPFPVTMTSSGIPAIKGGIELFDFDKTTGKISNTMLLEINDTSGNYYDACFSPDGLKLYVSKSSHRIYKGQVLQFDLSLEDLSAIIGSRNIVYEHLLDGLMDDNLGGLKRATDEKIYFISGKSPGLSSPFIHSVNDPNAYGSSCDIDPYAIMIPDTIIGVKEKGFPNDLVLIDSIVWDSVGSLELVYYCYKDFESISAIDTMGRNYMWADGAEGYVRAVSGSGDYIISYVNSDCKRAFDTFRVEFIHLPDYTEISYSCYDESNGLLWIGNAPGDTHYYTYNWMNAAGEIIQENYSQTGDTLHDAAPGMYSLHVSSVFGCDTILSLEVIAFPEPGDVEVTKDGGLCPGNPVYFSAESEEALMYEWSFGDGVYSYGSEVTHTYSVPRFYEVVLTALTQEGCRKEYFDYLTVSDFRIDLNASDTLVYQGDPVNFWVTSDDWIELYLWSPFYYFPDQGSVSQVAAFDTFQWIVVEGKNHIGCMAIDSILIKIRPVILMPNVFSPNGDGLNDLFKPSGIGHYTIRVFEVYNRFGHQVFYGFGPGGTVGWDGKWKGAPVEQGVYYYRIVADIGDSEPVTITGDVMLVR